MTNDLGVWTADDCALVRIAYQKEMFEVIRSETSADLVEMHVRLLPKTAKAFGLPIVLTTVGVGAGFNGPTLPSILSELDGIEAIDRYSMNAFEDEEFSEAVRATGRKRLISGGLHTEICLTFATVQALKDGYDVMYVTDAVGGRSQTAHRTAIERLAHAGAVPTTALAVTTELFRDWAGPLREPAFDTIYCTSARSRSSRTTSVSRMPRRPPQPPTRSRLPEQRTDAGQALRQGLHRHRHGRKHGTRNRPDVRPRRCAGRRMRRSGRARGRNTRDGQGGRRRDGVAPALRPQRSGRVRATRRSGGEPVRPNRRALQPRGQVALRPARERHRRRLGRRPPGRGRLDLLPDACGLASSDRQQRGGREHGLAEWAAQLQEPRLAVAHDEQGGDHRDDT